MKKILAYRKVVNYSKANVKLLFLLVLFLRRRKGFLSPYTTGQAGHGRNNFQGKDDSCKITLAIYMNYLSMVNVYCTPWWVVFRYFAWISSAGLMSPPEDWYMVMRTGYASMCVVDMAHRQECEGEQISMNGYTP